VSDLVRSSALAVLYFLVARLSLFFVVQPEGVAALWPVSGFMLAVLLLSPRQRWPLLILGGVIANVAANSVGGNSLAVSLGFALANLLESTVVAAVLIRFVGGPFSMNRLRDVAGLTFIGSVVCVGAGHWIGRSIR
jgi:integral membrane sensor domain MASE1